MIASTELSILNSGNRSFDRDSTRDAISSEHEIHESYVRAVGLKTTALEQPQIRHSGDELIYTAQAALSVF